VSLVCLAILILAAGPAAAQDDEGRATVRVLTVDDTITPVVAQYVERIIEDAEEDGASAVVIELDTPGGLSSAMDDIIRDILESEVPVVVYVSPNGARAASAGVFITYAGHVAAMAPGTRIGSASPIFIDDSGEVSDGSETLQRKVTNDAVSQIKNLANLRGRNAEWAERAVREAANVTADEALQMDVVDIIAPSLPELLDEIDGTVVDVQGQQVALATRNAEIERSSMNAVEGLLQILAEPTIAYILLSLGMLGLFLELTNPGAIAPGVIGVLSLLLALYSLGTLPVNWTAVLLIAFAFILFAIDLFVPSFGILTIGGIVSFLLGSYLLIDSDAPPGFEISRPVIWTVTGCIVAFFLWLAGSVLRARFRPAYTGKQALVGQLGDVRRALSPDGMVYVHGELWSAVPDAGVHGELPVGTNVVVTAVERMRLRVRPATAEEIEQEAAERARENLLPADRGMPRPAVSGAESSAQRVT
jgi:membrane-bound serine protease (ClpP class)